MLYLQRRKRGIKINTNVADGDDVGDKVGDVDQDDDDDYDDKNCVDDHHEQ